jgi:outer membrane protein assembly factor BamB
MDAVTGALRWTSHEPGAFPNDLGIPAMAGMAVSPDGTRLYIAGAHQLAEQGPSSFHVILVLAYDSSSGERLWDAKVGGLYPTGGEGTRSGLFIEVGTPIAVAPDGSRVYVTGTLSDLTSEGVPLQYAIITAAIDSATGTEVWRHEFDEGRPRRTFWPYLPALAVSDDSVFVASTRSVEVVVPFVTSQYEDQFNTMSLDAATGAEQWLGRWGEGRSRPAGIAVTPGGDRVFVTGDTLALTERNEGSWDLVTVAYDTD